MPDKVNSNSTPIREQPGRKFMIGLAASIPFVVAFMILSYWHGSDSRVLIHDNLDSNVAQFPVLAKSEVFSGSINSVFEPMLGGIPRNSMRSELHLPLLTYRYLPPLWAFVVNECVMRMTALVGMALLLNRILPAGSSRWIVFGVAICFSLLPFHPAGHLSVAGLPLLMYAVCQLAGGQRGIVYWLIVGLFPFFSSVVLIGFVLVMLLALFAAWRSLRERRLHVPLVLSFLLLTGGYLISEFRLVYQVISPASYTSHRVEIATRHKNTLAQALNTAGDNFRYGQYHAASLQHPVILFSAVLAPLLAIVWHLRAGNKQGPWLRRLADRDLWYTLSPFLVAFATATAISLWYGLFSWQETGDFIGMISKGGFKTFNWSRVHWLHPLLWSLVFAFALVLIARWPRVGTLLAVALIGLQLVKLAREHDRLYHKQELSFREFYSPELFDTIRDKIGRPQQDYRVASLGFHPSIPLYNGFYTADGFAVNYPLPYKHRFRKVIAAELDKNAELRRYFDDWGCRCYLFSSELGKNYFYTKHHQRRVVEHLEIDATALKELGCEYVISAVEIARAKNTGLDLIEVFERDDSPWKIYLYSVRGSTPAPSRNDRTNSQDAG